MNLTQTLSPRVPLGCRLLLLSALAAALAGCATKGARGPSAAVVEAPVVEAQSAVADPSAGFYRVKPGETLSGIANAFGRAPAQVARWNHLSVTDAVTTGQVLRVAPPAEPSAKAAPRPKASPASPAVTAPPTLQSSPTPPTSPTKSARFMWPVSGAVKGKYSDARSRGIVLDGRPGEPVKAAEGGRVVFAGDRIKAYGRLIVLKHDAHLVTAYANNRKLLVAEGAVVTQGQTIAEMGVDASGKGALKFEVRDDGKPVDPLTYLPKPRS